MNIFLVTLIALVVLAMLNSRPKRTRPIYIPIETRRCKR